MSARYRKKPVEVDAMCVVDTGKNNNWDAVAKWCGGRVEYGRLNDVVTRYIAISTLEGIMVAKAGDWVIRGVAGEFYPCRPDIFEATYEPAGDAP